MASSQKRKQVFSEQVIDREEWSTFAPSFMQIAAQGPGIAPAQAMVDGANQLVPFSTATLVVDMGCGPGQITDAVLQKHSTALPPTARVIGADNSPQMLAQYAGRKDKELSGGKEYWARAETAQTDIHDCAALADGSVTHMLAGFVVFLVPDPAGAVEAMRSKLAPGGVLAFSAWEASDWQELMYFPQKVRPDLVMPAPPAEWTRPEGVRGKLREIAGFGGDDVTVEQVEGYWPFADYDEVCRFILTKMPLAARVVAQMSDEEVSETHALMVGALKEKYPSVPARMVGTATVAYCLK